MSNPTKSDATPVSKIFVRLNIQQQQAIELLLIGKADSEVAHVKENALTVLEPSKHQKKRYSHPRNIVPFAPHPPAS